MTAPRFKTKAEQKLEWLWGLRQLTDDQSEELRRALHAAYMRRRRLEEV